MSRRAQPAPPVRRVALPTGAQGPVRVFVNGEEWAEGEDFTVDERGVNFIRPLRPRPALGLGRTIMLSLGIGVYGDLRGDTLDLHYKVDGQPRMVNVPLRVSAGS
jgi:hypothetical protein